MDKLPQEYQDFWKRWNDFEGKSDVREYWIPVFINIVIGLIFTLIGTIIGSNFLGSLFWLAAFIPGISIMIRRFHDTGHSGWYWLWIFLPFIGWIIVLIALIQNSK